MAPTSRTPQEFFDAYVSVLEGRLQANPSPSLRPKLEALKAQGPPGLLVPGVAVQLLQEFPPAPDGPPGPCHYIVNNTDFCLPNLTPQECMNLHGKSVPACGTIPPYPG
jgi:hypothetical protein